MSIHVADSHKLSPNHEEDTNNTKDNIDRRRGLQLLYRPLPNKTRAMTTKPAATMTFTVSPTTLVMPLPREPRTFCRTTFEDQESWLETYERTAAYKWDLDDKLHHVYFSLEDSTRIRFENVESTMTTWDNFQNHLPSRFHYRSL